MLARSDGRRGNAHPLVVALHARGADARSELAAARSQFGDGPDLVALQAARPCNPLQSNLRREPAYAGFSWYLGDDPERPEPASFGDALAEIDAFTATLRRPFLLRGCGQGAVLALTLALYAPGGLARVEAIGGGLPQLPQWRAPRESLAAVGFRLVDLPPGSAGRCVSMLRERGAADIVVVTSDGFEKRSDD